MAKKPQKPKLVIDDILTEIYNRTGAPINGIYQIYWTYNEIVKQAIENGVDVTFGDICVFTHKDVKPHLSREHYDLGLQKWVKDVPIDGKFIPKIRWNQRFVRELREKTRYSIEEEKTEQEEMKNG